ncbi:MAG: VanZ family protein [Clostridium fessum]
MKQGRYAQSKEKNRMTRGRCTVFSFLAGYVRIMWKRTKTHQKVCWIFFVAYLVLLIYFMFFSDGFGRAPHVGYAYNLVLFKEIKRFYIYRDIVGTEAFLLNTAGNVVCFMPFGFFLPIISPRFGKWYLMLILSFLLTLSIETIQLVFKVGSFDVDDMFLNTLGGIAGYLCQWIARCSWEVSAWDVKQITGFLISASRWQNTAISAWDWRSRSAAVRGRDGIQCPQ